MRAALPLAVNLGAFGVAGRVGFLHAYQVNKRLRERIAALER
jgi:hypothetical protein